MANPRNSPQFSKAYARHLYVWAVEFYQTYQAVATAPTLGSYPGVDHKFLGMSHFALCHALELTFKSLLVDTGTYNEQMLMDKKLGHDLVALAGEVKQVYGSFPEVDACMGWIQIRILIIRGKAMSIPFIMGASQVPMQLNLAKQWMLYFVYVSNRAESPAFRNCLLPPLVIKKTKSLQTA